MDDLENMQEQDAQGLEHKILTLVARMSRDVAEGGLGTGEMAELRRWRLGGEIQPAAWRLLAQHIFPAGEAVQELENRWLAILSGMAQMSPHPHRSGAFPGKVLAGAGFSENRFHKLLNSRNEAFFDAVDRTCRFLRAKGEPIDWIRFAHFILAMDPDKAESQRRILARGYFSHKPQ
ncbi:MAG: type I-E CRISPR-associated protein Cse2/CasB [Magnetococcales bacterium]|nr:type I-E CRISPR-associated protein Cse2/CasB [Magnetococcales bacterium]